MKRRPDAAGLVAPVFAVLPSLVFLCHSVATCPRRLRPKHIASALQIMIEGPLGAADYNNEFGRPTLGGFFRCYESRHGDKRWGFHKPLMLAGGLGHILPHSAVKRLIMPGAKIIQLGGPGFRIGMGGGTASSRTTGDDAALDFDSVQRGNAEMQRRAQEVIEHCRHGPDGGKILSLHDVGAGGLANAVIELGLSIWTWRSHQFGRRAD